MAGFLDFLQGIGKTSVPITPFNPNAPTEGPDLGGVDPTEMGAFGASQAPAQPKKEGLLSRIMATGDDGVTFGDKLYAAGGIIKGDGDPLSQINAKRTEYKANEKTRLAEEKQQAARARQAAALRASYVNGKFNPQAYIEAMAGDVTPDELAVFTKFAPKGGVDGGFAYTTDAFSGDTTFGDQRPMSYNEQIAQDRLDEQERRNQVLEQIAMGNLGVRQGQLGLSRQREGRIASQPKGSSGGGVSGALPAGIPPPPGGYRIVRP